VLSTEFLRNFLPVEMGLQSSAPKLTNRQQNQQRRPLWWFGCLSAKWFVSEWPVIRPQRLNDRGLVDKHEG
jgi:hypothetical protein